MEKRTILAFALSILVLIGFDFVYKNYFTDNETAQIQTAVTPRAETSATPSKAAAPIEKNEAQLELQPPPETDTRTDGPKEVIVKADLYQAVLNSNGAVLTSWILKDYKTTSIIKATPGKNFEMIASTIQGEKWSSPGSLYFEDSKITALANEEIYEVSVNGTPYSGMPVSAPADVVMTLRRGDLAIKKTYSFDKDNYTVGLSADLRNGGKGLEGQYLIGQDIGPAEEHLEEKSSVLKAVYLEKEKVRRESTGDNMEIARFSGDIRWIGLDMLYFTAIAIPEKSIPYFETKTYEIKASDMQNNSVDRSLLAIKIPVDESFKFQMYLGPKKQSNLKAVSQQDLSGVIDYGMFTIIVLPLLSALRWIFQYVHNYGVSIILLTFILSLLLFPFRLKQMVSMKKMQVVQPKVKAIQEKYKRYKKTDPKRAEMNTEIMALYKENNVNPLGGCLPLLLQFPILLAFYSLLANSIELRHAPFFWWIQDLSTKDPIYVLPIVMGVTMFISQKMTPMAPTTDAANAKIMQYLPVVFTFMFMTVSAGLNLYFLCSNIFQVGFQKIAERWMGDGRNDRKSTRK